MYILKKNCGQTENNTQLTTIIVTLEKFVLWFQFLIAS